MLQRTLKIVFLFYILFVLFGCATKTAFIYDPPSKQSVTLSAGRVLLCKETNDLRKENSIDNVYEANTLSEIRNIVEQEMMSTGLFEKIVWTKASQEKIKGQTGQLFLETSLKDLSWEVPDYDSILRNSVIFGFATGLVGGLIYGATTTDVNGTSKLSVQLVDSAGKTLIDKEYSGVYKTSKSKFSCDTVSTKAEVVGKALKDVMEQFKTDLIRTLTTIDANPSVSPTPAEQATHLPGKS